MTDVGEARDAVEAIREVVDRETRAWDTADVDLLLSIFHPDFVWPWPSDAGGHDPMTWEMPMGRFDQARWSSTYEEHFRAFELVHNVRTTRRVEATAQGDGGLAVVDVDTLWRNRSAGVDFRWLGRACKVYARTDAGWKLTMHTGLLDYGQLN